MKTVNLTCIGCPLGCAITLEMNGDEIVSITGNTCKIGENHARKEMTNPTRIVTSTVKVIGGRLPVVSVKTAADIPKDKIFDCVRILQSVEVAAPVCIGQVIVSDILGTGVDIIATRNVVCQ